VIRLTAYYRDDDGALVPLPDEHDHDERPRCAICGEREEVREWDGEMTCGQCRKECE
jgi:hypothetical protein